MPLNRQNHHSEILLLVSMYIVLADLLDQVSFMVELLFWFFLIIGWQIVRRLSIRFFHIYIQSVIQDEMSEGIHIIEYAHLYYSIFVGLSLSFERINIVENDSLLDFLHSLCF